MTALRTAPPTLDRHRALAALRQDPTVDVLILGGGINGAATFRELALQGLRCALIEKDDFAAGASGASTRIAQGGLRYLDQGRLRLVRESSVERNRLVENAVHLVSPLQVAIPVDSIWGGVWPRLLRLAGLKAKRGLPGLAVLRLALTLYDQLGRRDRTLPPHGSVRGAALRALIPDFAATVRGLGWSWEGRIGHPERIVVELAEDAVAANPAAVALNHCSLVGRDGADILLTDDLGGAGLAVRPGLVVNATGAWADRTNRLLGIDHPLVQGSKGSHLLLDNPRLREALKDRLIFFGDGRSRMCVAYPFGQHVLVGATDIPVEDPDGVFCDDDEIAYLLRSLARLYPGIPLAADQILYRWCGVRPLPRAAAGDIGEVSRDHSVVDLPAGRLPFPLLTLVGGKWTTFRAVAEQIADQALDRLGRRRLVDTAHLPIGGARAYPRSSADKADWIAALGGRTGLAEGSVARLLARYGTRAAAVAEHCAAAADAPLPDAEDYSDREIHFLITREMACTLEDIVGRRTTLALTGRVSRRLIDRLSALLAEAGGRPDQPRLMTYLARHGVATDVPPQTQDRPQGEQP